MIKSNRISLIFVLTFLSSLFLAQATNAQKDGFDDKLVAGLLSSYYGPKGIGLGRIKNKVADFCEAKGRSYAMKAIILRDGRLLLSRNANWFVLELENDLVIFQPLTPPRDVQIAFEGTDLNQNFVNGNFAFAQTDQVCVIPAAIVSAERFLDHLISWLRARGIRDLSNRQMGPIAMYDLIAHNHFVRVTGAEDIELVLFGLRELGYDLELRDRLGDTMLLAAIRDENVDFVTALLNFGANTDIQDAFENTPQEIALDTGNEDLMEILDLFIGEPLSDDEEKEREEDESDCPSPEVQRNNTDLMQVALDEQDFEVMSLLSVSTSGASASF